ncbi:MAG: glutamyl-tRNA reductase [Desulfobacterales bacterium]|jgi:glutamyl-tRNA reductase|nr:glutamyl-tRNA reductase [Desulfobacteraceae bacterium]MDD3991617.1 glutamyl-tRNA reductase [Desulfobacteraceae bacterium]MDY0311092.1 glutamyl-tRNA reductase [Desulfobacterales bacterium]
MGSLPDSDQTNAVNLAPGNPRILLMGLNHQTAPVALRECLAFSPEETETALEALIHRPCIREALLLSTCNRVEVVVTCDDPARAIADLEGFISDFKHIPIDEFRSSLYRYVDNDAVRHLFRVASSLDSMVVGEPQILGQIKAAYGAAIHRRASGVILNRLLHRTFFVAKRIRTETGIGDHAVSISYAAIELARKIFGSLEGRRVLLIGAGEMAELAVEHLIRHRAGEILVANRTFAHGVSLAQRFGGQAIRFEEVEARLATVDIIISSTGAPGFVVVPAQVSAVLRHRRNRPLFFIDIAVPRDIDPRVNRLSNVYVYDIDDLKGVVEENVQDRQQEALKAERIIDEAVLRFSQWRQSLEVVPTIVALHRKLELIADAEIKKTLQGSKPPDEAALKRMATAMINKFLHDPTQILKGDGHRGNRQELLGLLQRLFHLDTP